MSEKKKRKNSSSSIKMMPRNEKYRKVRTSQGRPAAAGAAAAAAARATAVRTAPPIRKAKKKTWVRSGFDYPLFTIVIVLLAFGIIMMFSASYATAFAETGDSMYYLKRQAVFAIGGLVIMMILSTIDYHIFRSKVMVYGIGAVSMGLMLAVFVIGTIQNGAGRWLQIGEITFQPSEILKLAVIIFFAYFAEKHFDRLREFKRGFLPLAAVLAVSCGILMAQPHLSGTIIVFSIGFSMMFVAGVNLKHLFLMLGGLILLVVVAILMLNAMGIDYFSDRILSFTDPEADIDNSTFQTYQSLVTIGSGGLFGLGFGNSRQKYGYMPMSRNDFIFSIICEELGFVGAVLVILLFVIFVWRGFHVCTRARDKFGMMLAFGITFQIGLQALLNIAVVTNSIPNTGISLPFFSYGGTALVMQMAEMGILLSVSRKAELE